MRSSSRLWTSRRNFYLSALTIAAAVAIFQFCMERASYHGIVSSISLNQSEGNSNNPYQFPKTEEKALDTYSTMSGLLTTLATALLGALGYLLINQRNGSPDQHHGLSAVGTALFAVLSIYFGYVSHLTALSFSYNNLFNPDLLGVKWPSRSQFYTLLLAAFFFADFSFHEFSRESSE